jgi:hypothetical protein
MKKGQYEDKQRQASGTGYFSLDALQQIGESLKIIADELKSSPKSFVGKSVAQGATYALKAVGSAGESIHRMANDGISVLQMMERHPEIKMADVVKSGKHYIDHRTRVMLQKLSEVVNKGRVIADGIGCDAKKAMKNATENTQVCMINEKVSDGYRKIRSLMKLPSREDFENLAKAIEKLANRVDALKDKRKGTGHA